MFIAMTASCDTSQQLLVFVVTRSEKLELAAEERRYRINLAKAQGSGTGKVVGLACWNRIPPLSADSSVSGCFQI